MNYKDDKLLNDIYYNISCSEIESIYILFDDADYYDYDEIKEALVGEYLVEGNEYYMEDEKNVGKY